MALQFRPSLPASRGPALSAVPRHPGLELLRRYAPAAVVAGVIGGLAGLGLSQLATPTYAATTTLYFSINYGASGSDLNQGSSYAQAQMLSFAELARSARVLAPVVSSLDLDASASQLAANVTATTPPNTVVLDITAQSSSASRAADIADGVAQSLISTVKDIAPHDADGRDTVTVRTVQPAEVPVIPVAPNIRVNIVAGVVIGIVLALVLVYLIRGLDTRVRGDGAVASGGGLPLLGRVKRDPSEGLALQVAPEGNTAEGYRRLAETLPAVLPEAPSGARGATKHTPVVVLVSPGADTSTAAVAANLAIAAASQEQSVLLCVPDPKALTGMPETVLVRGLPPREGLAATETAKHALVLIAAPAFATSARAIPLARAADGAILLADTTQVRIGELANAVDQLRTAGVSVLGTVLTGFRADASTSRQTNVARAWRARRLPQLKHHEA